MAKQHVAGIKNMIIDMGGVILDIDFSLTANAFQELGIYNFDTLFSKAKQSHFIEEFERGDISTDTFRNEIRKLCEKDFLDAEIDQAWNALILDMKQSKLNAIQQLSARFNLYLLSNNNEIHYQRCIEKINALLPFEQFSNHFQQNYYSHQIRIRKPDKEAFEFVLGENRLVLSETIFLDDSPQHIESAAALGLQTITINNTNTIEQLVTEINY